MEPKHGTDDSADSRPAQHLRVDLLSAFDITLDKLRRLLLGDKSCLKTSYFSRS